MFVQVGIKATRSTLYLFAQHRIPSHQLYLSIVFTSIFLAKILRLYAHLNSIPPVQFLLWGPTFFLQDIIVVLLARELADRRWRFIPRSLAASSIALLSLIVLFMTSVELSFYVIAGAEIHWRQITSYPINAAGVRTLLYGSTSCFLCSVFVIFISVMLTPHLWSSYFMRRQQPCIEEGENGGSHYADESHAETLSSEHDDSHTEKHAMDATTSPKKQMVMAISAALLILLRVIRPHDSAYLYLSWTLPLSPFANTGHQREHNSKGSIPDLSSLGNCTALATPPEFNWLPDDMLAGFEDWYMNSSDPHFLHYSPAKDCLRVSNLDNPLLDSVRTAIEDDSVKVKHIIVIMLESTRKDVFPLVRDGHMWNRIAKSYGQNHIPSEIEQVLGELTTAAEYLTGEVTGLRQQDQAGRFRGGISASNAFTTSSYTLKSVVGTLCGITPLTIDFGQEYKHHIYQPCLAHILEALNRQPASANRKDIFTSWPWRSLWMQSVTNTYDNQDILTPALGYNASITRETLIDPNAPFFPPKGKDINYYGLSDSELKPYLRKTIEDAEKSQERLFLTHLTSATHHPWGLPEDFPFQQYLQYSGYGNDRKLNRYLNTIGLVDNWLGDMLSVLDETGVANETLLVLAGDHGTSLPDDGANTPYSNPHVGSFHVPLVISHPALPSIQIQDPVSSLQILPTILDLLVSTSSLTEAANKVASDLLPLYEGQSLLRPLLSTSSAGNASWQFSVMNPGGSWISMRSANEPFHLVAPLVTEVEWRFTDLDNDPHELEAILVFDWLEFVRLIRQRHGERAADWVQDAARVAEWWVAENHRLWRVD